VNSSSPPYAAAAISGVPHAFVLGFVFSRYYKTCHDLAAHLAAHERSTRAKSHIVHVLLLFNIIKELLTKT
jgi:hypothetical protein